MKRVASLFVLLLCFSFVLASVSINDYYVDTTYIKGVYLDGEVNLTIEGASYEDSVYSNWGHSVFLGDFLEASGEDFSCSPADCLSGYEFFNEEVEKNVFIDEEVAYVGFYLEGNDVEIKNLIFDMGSDFGESSTLPLKIVFFEEKEWLFDLFSRNYLDNKNWGCYDEDEGEVGALIGESFYCEMTTVPDSGSLKIGAKIGGSDAGNVTMIVYSEDEGDSWDCEFDPNSEESCEIFPTEGDIFESGNYQICVGADALTGYRIYEENDGSNCGFVYGSSAEDSVKDYSIFIQSAKYASAGGYSWDFDFDELVQYANDIIDERYDDTCEDGCILPISFFGMSQNIDISNVVLTYTDDGEWETAGSLYDLELVPASVDFEGVLDLSLLEFEINDSGEFELYIDDDKLLEEDFDLSGSLSVVSVAPLNPPYGFSVNFYASVDYNDTGDIVYSWDFGDGVSFNVTDAVVMHEYNESGSYVLTLGVKVGDYYVEREFDIETISPNASIASSLDYKSELLEGVKSTIDSLSSWYGDKIFDMLDLDSVSDDLESWSNAYINSDYDEDDLIDIAHGLSSLAVPSEIRSNIVSYPYFINNVEDVDVEPIETLTGSIGGATNDLYAEYVLTWQNSNINVEYVISDFYVDYDNDSSSALISVYGLDILSLAEEKAYLVIDKAFSDLTFRDNSGVRDVGSYTVVELDANEDRLLEFYYKGAEDISLFVSPALSSLILEGDVEGDCNYNGVCEGENGENWRNCRTDCKPVVWAIVWFCLGFFVLFLVYFALQVWYRRRYEGYLFKDSAQLYNLLMYISNARARGQSDSKIEGDLKAKGWSGERVNYVMKKSRGERIGMLEIIPIEKILALLRDRKAKKKQNVQVATVNQGNDRGNFNKSGVSRRF